MKILKIKRNNIINIILVVMIVFVVTVGFIPSSESDIQVFSTEAIYRGNQQKNNVSLMFNVYENSAVVENIVKTLNNYNVKATFFVGGCWADDNMNTLKFIYDNGHEIGNHGYFHKDHKQLDYNGNKKEIDCNNKLIKGLIDFEPKLFAPPSGSYSKTTLSVAKELNMQVIMWSKDTIDWRDSDENVLLKRAINNLSNGDLILMHPKQHTLNILPKIIENIFNLRYNIVVVSQNISS